MLDGICLPFFSQLSSKKKKKQSTDLFSSLTVIELFMTMKHVEDSIYSPSVAVPTLFEVIDLYI